MQVEESDKEDKDVVSSNSRQSVALKHTILHVDDYAPFLGVISNILESEYDIVSVLNPRQCLPTLLTCRPSLIILDMEMNDLDGLELCKQIRSKDVYNDIPILIYTANKTTALKRRAIKLGAADLIQKGSGVEFLCDWIDAQLNEENVQ